MKSMLKRCPVCERTYPDRSTAYCTVDGATLSPPFDPDATQQLFPPLAIISPPENLSPNLVHTQSTWRSSRLLFLAVAMVALIMGILIVPQFQTGTKDVPSTNSLATAQEESKQFTINDPSDGANVGYAATIHGTTPFPNENHYIIVTPLNKVSWVWPATVESDGSLSGSVQFGEGARGKGESFGVRVLATKSTMPIGVLSEEPKDAKNSKAITVTRTD